nr:hypothetical protein [Olsenella uli]
MHEHEVRIVPTAMAQISDAVRYARDGPSAGVRRMGVRKYSAF